MDEEKPEPLDGDALKSLFGNAKKHALYQGFSEWDAEEIAQEVVLNRIEKNYQGQSIHFAVIDAIRKLRGRSKTKSHDLRKSAESKYIQIENLYGHAEDKSNPIDDGGFEFKGDAETLSNRLMGFDRAIFILKVKWGMNSTEIAHVFGVSISRVNQREDELKARLKDYVK